MALRSATAGVGNSPAAKFCPDCRQTLPAEDFTRDRRRIDGLCYYCRRCWTARTNVERRCWRAMIERCTDPRHPSFPDYGGRGISVCDRWRESFDAFLSDVGRRPSPQHSLDRINNDGNYGPGNCRWATQKEQARNTRRNVILSLHGRSQCLSAWALELGIPRPTLDKRKRSGWSDGRTLTEPVRPGVSLRARRAV